MKDYSEIRQTRSMIDQMNELYIHVEEMQLQEQVLTRLSNHEPLDELLPWAFPVVGTEEGDLEDMYAVCAYYYHNELGQAYLERVKQFVIMYQYLHIDDYLTKEEQQRIYASVSIFHEVDNHSILHDYLIDFQEGKPNAKVLRKLKPQIESYLRRSVCGKHEITDRPLFEGGCFESDHIDMMEVLDIWMWLYQHGYSPVTMGRQYLVSHTDIYTYWRRSALSSRFYLLTLDLIHTVLEDSNYDKELKHLYATILNPEDDEDWDWIHHAMFFEEALHLCNEKVSDLFPMLGYDTHNRLIHKTMFYWELRLRQQGLIKELSKD